VRTDVLAALPQLKGPDHRVEHDRPRGHGTQHLRVGGSAGLRWQFTGSFDAAFQAEGIRVLASPPQAPRANAVCESAW
jgi:hypothetical protein